MAPNNGLTELVLKVSTARVGCRYPLSAPTRRQLRWSICRVISQVDAAAEASKVAAEIEAKFLLACLFRGNCGHDVTTALPLPGSTPEAIL
jgi:hypothetical protein